MAIYASGEKQSQKATRIRRGRIYPVAKTSVVYLNKVSFYRDVTRLARHAAVELQLDWNRHDIMTPARVKPFAGPPWSVTDYDRRRQTPSIVTSLAPYTMCRRASSK